MSFSSWRDSVIADQSKYVWYFGVCGFGVLFGLWMAVSVWFVHDWANHGVWSNLLKSAGFLIFGPVAGLAWGTAMWHLHVKRRRP